MEENLNKKIVSVLRPFGLPVFENVYQGAASSWFTYNVALDAEGDAGDDVPLAYVTTVQIHYCCPLADSYADMKRRIITALLTAGFTAPEVTDMSDETEKIRHLVFECEIENNYNLEVENG